MELIYLFCPGIRRPFRPRPPPDQAADDQQAATEENQGHGEVKQTEASKVPQTNGEVAEGQKQQQQPQRRQSRRRRQRTSESSTSKVRATTASSALQVFGKWPECRISLTFFFFLAHTKE